ncbi:MAG: 3'(2'),5'-bisphosphate nucleotidase CysQ [Deltaproteobacteria bacterium]|nr:3'(2'),5'-bisphosphate nucleotidase CysQ [Deltaproteobacteria bacterium]
MEPYEREAQWAARLAREAGAITLRHRVAGFSVVDKPDDEGPVTAADRECDAFIRAELTRGFPADGLLTEETPDDGAWRKSARVWMVDPLDGTKEFVKGGDDFACMVGLCLDGVPVVGAVYRPALDVLFWAGRGLGAFLERDGVRTPLHVPRGQPEHLVVAVTRSHRGEKLERILAGLGPLTEFPSGSVGLKIGLIATGVAHAYINGSSRTCLWDTCGPEAILREAGGHMTDLLGGPVRYDAGLKHPHGLFCATADVHAALKDRVADTARKLAALPLADRS